MGIKYVIVLGFLMCVAVIFWFCFYSPAIKPPIKQGEPNLELSLQKLDPNAKKVIVRLVVTNVGEHRLIVPRLREYRLKRSVGWGGWGLHITHKQAGFFLLSARRIPPFKKRHLIDLEPGERFTVNMNIARAWRSVSVGPADGDSPQHPELVSVDGEYEVKVRLSLGNHNILPDLQDLVWKGEVESNIIRSAVDTSEKYN